MRGAIGRRSLGFAIALGSILLVVGQIFDNPRKRHVAPDRVGPFGSRPVNAALGTAAANGDVVNVRKLLDAGVSPDAVVPAPGLEGHSALELSAGSGSLAVVRLLLDRGADVNAPNEWGGNALIAGAFAGEPAIVDLLINRGADVNADDDGATALGYAMNMEQRAQTTKERRNYQQVIRLLRAAGAQNSSFWFR